MVNNGSGSKIPIKRIRVNRYRRRNGKWVRGYSYRRRVKKDTRKGHKKAPGLFCPDCGSLLIPIRQNRQTILICPKDGSSFRTDKMKTTQRFKRTSQDKTIIIEDTGEDFSSIAYCEKCKKKVPVKIWQVQLRSSDEPSTTFYRDKKGHTWRE